MTGILLSSFKDSTEPNDNRDRIIRDPLNSRQNKVTYNYHPAVEINVIGTEVGFFVK